MIAIFAQIIWLAAIVHRRRFGVAHRGQKVHWPHNAELDELTTALGHPPLPTGLR